MDPGTTRFVDPGRWLAAALLIGWLSACGGGGSGGPVSSGSLSVTGCVVPVDAADCEATVAWTTRDAGAPRVTIDGETSSDRPVGSAAIRLGGEFVVVSVLDGARELDSITFRAACESASAWNGRACAAYGVREDSMAPTPFVEGDGPVELEVVLFRPLGDGPFPTVVFHHGSTGNGSDPSLFPVTTLNETVAEWFVRRGWMVAFPQRRGRGKSGGVYDEGFNAGRTAYSCQRGIALTGAERAVADADAAVDWLRSRADVDTTAMLSAGVSRGGVLALIHVAHRPDVFLGAVNFVGGWLGEGCGDYLDVNRTLFMRAARFPGATIWLYADHDSFYSIAHSRTNFDAYTAAGGLGAFRVHGRAPGLNGHFLANDAGLWGPDVDAYLALVVPN